jgi:Flp pilus assembly protein TadG
MLPHLTRRLRRFRDDESGLILAEFVIVLPLLVWAFMALFVYWDVFRSMNNVQKATYAISDLISRQQNDLQADFIPGMQTTMDYLLPDTQLAKMRFTSVKWSVPNDRFEVIWSRSPGGKMTQLNNASLQSYVTKIPVMAPTDTVVIVESEVPYTPSLKVGLDPSYTFSEFIVTRPRFLAKICLAGVSCT